MLQGSGSQAFYPGTPCSQAGHNFLAEFSSGHSARDSGASLGGGQDHAGEKGEISVKRSQVANDEVGMRRKVVASALM